MTIKNARMQAGLSQAQLTKRIGATHPNHHIKICRAKRQNTYFENPSTCNAIFSQIPQSAIEQCSASTLNDIADAIQHAYQAGRAKAGAEMIDNNAVWVDSIKKVIEWDKNFNCKIA